MTCTLDVIVQEPPTFAVTPVGVTVMLMAPSVVSAVGAEIAIAESVPIVVQLGDPTMAVVLADAPIVAMKEIVQPMWPGPVSLATTEQLMRLVELIGRFSVLPAITRLTVPPVPPPE